MRRVRWARGPEKFGAQVSRRNRSTAGNSISGFTLVSASSTWGQLWDLLSWLFLLSSRQGEYGRPLVTVYRNRGDTVSVNQKMIESGIVNVYDGKKKSGFDNLHNNAISGSI